MTFVADPLSAPLILSSGPSRIINSLLTYLARFPNVSGTITGYSSPRVDTKVAVHNTVILTVLLYGSEPIVAMCES